MLNFQRNTASEQVHCATRTITISSGRCLSSVISEISVNFFHQKEGKISNSTGEPSQRKWHRWLRKQLHVLISRVGRIESHAIRRENSLTKIDRDVSVTSNVNKILRIRPKLKIRKKSKKYNKIFKIRKYHYWNGTKSTSNRVIRCNSWFPALGCCSWSRFSELHRIT